MKYKVVHTYLQSNKPVDEDNAAKGFKLHEFKQDQHVTAAELKAAGFDVEFLERNGSIEKLEGSESEPEPPTTTQDATPGMGDAPEGPGEPTAEDRKVGEKGRGRK